MHSISYHSNSFLTLVDVFPMHVSYTHVRKVTFCIVLYLYMTEYSGRDINTTQTQFIFRPENPIKIKYKYYNTHSLSLCCITCIYFPAG